MEPPNIQKIYSRIGNINEENFIWICSFQHSFEQKLIYLREKGYSDFFFNNFSDLAW